MGKEEHGAVSAQKLQAILEAIHSVRHGTVTLIIQDGNLIRMEKLEKYLLK